MSIEGTGESAELTPATMSIEADPPSEEETYVLITQCLQNDFFFNLNCRLVLPGDAAGKLLVHPLSEEGLTERKSRRVN